MAITSEIIGKLGGAGVEVVPVSGNASGGSGSEVILHTVESPEGEDWLVAVRGGLNSANSGSIAAQLIAGGEILPKSVPNGPVSLAHVGSGTINVKLRRNTALGSDSFTGHVYTVKL